MSAIRVLPAMLALAMIGSCAGSPPSKPEATEPFALVEVPVTAPDMPVQLFQVKLAPSIAAPQSGRLIIITQPWSKVFPAGAPSDAPPMVVRGAGEDPIAAAEIAHLAPDQSVIMDADAKAFPMPFRKMPPGDYAVQAVLDVNHSYAYGGPGEGDIRSAAIKVHLPAPRYVPMLVLSEVLKAPTAPPTSAGNPEFDSHLTDVDFISPSLSAFWGRPMHIRAWVLTPPGYEKGSQRYPTVYRAEGFGGTRPYSRVQAQRHWNLMASGATPPMIRVFLDHSTPWGTTEFADSVNNGPWGKALTEEFIPYLEKNYRMDAKPSGRFTTGHSSGGWFAIWLQVRYPKVFGGTWARAPDPVDFRSFTGVDIYAPHANAYRRPDGSVQTLVRNARGEETTSLREYAGREDIAGDYGGQFDSFDWVFSPKGDDGRPMPLFDRETGDVDPAVAAYWREHYDISAIVERDWKTLKPDLDGKIHLIVGTMDTFHLNEAAELLKQRLDALGAKSSFTFMAGRTHGTLDRIGDNPLGLETDIAWQMWKTARSKSGLVAPDPSLAPKSRPAPVKPGE
jgi:enterochelin esterase-like enzyme